VNLTTPRLTLRYLIPEDSPFILELLTSPTWLEFIGDRGVHTLQDADGYIARMQDRYVQLGFGFCLVQLADSTKIGICGLIQRDHLPDVDIGFALLPQFAGQGYALEAAWATLEYARDTLKLARLAGITTPDNTRSIRVLEMLGLQFERTVTLAPDDALLNYYARDL
jgi:RimJ/RimL family protein N-acetyltransferase